MSAFFKGEAVPDSDSVVSFQGVLRYGSIPIIAAIIGYGTNVVAVQMMFYPIHFVGCFKWAKIGLGLDVFLFGWQGVVPMKAKEMAEISIDLLTTKLIRVEEIFSRLDPDRIATEIGDSLHEASAEIINEAGHKHCPRMWEHLPMGVRKQLEEKVAADAPAMMSRFFADLQKNINDVFDLKYATVKSLVDDPQILVDIFWATGTEELVFIQNSGFYFGYLFGICQMLVWLFVTWLRSLYTLYFIFGPLHSNLPIAPTLYTLFLPFERRLALRRCHASPDFGRASGCTTWW
jgi:hypothetical protein